MRKIKANDQVVVIAGKDKGKRGTVKKVLIDSGRVIVGGVNILKKHTKPNPQMGIQGGITEIEASIDLSNVAIINPKTNKADRVGIRVQDGKRVRVFKSTGDLIDA